MPTSVDRAERSGVALPNALLGVVLSTEADWQYRAAAARLLALTDASLAADSLLDLFFRQVEKSDLWNTALTMESFGHRSLVGPVIEALQDDNSHRRHAAARVLGWIPRAGGRACEALMSALLDPSQAQAVREEAAESLAYFRDPRVIPALISVLKERDVRLRFWAVFALGTPRRAAQGSEMKAIRALETVLDDDEVPPGNWWAVGREALAMLACIDPSYRARLIAEVSRVLANENATPENRRWAEYGR